MAMNNYLSIITLKVNGLNAPIKRHRIAEWIRKHDPTYAAFRRPSSEQKTYTEGLESESLQTNIPSKWIGKKS